MYAPRLLRQVPDLEKGGRGACKRRAALCLNPGWGLAALMNDEPIVCRRRRWRWHGRRFRMRDARRIVM
jgi:hypothetical protein